MWILSILILFAVFVLILTFVIGIVVLIFGKLRKNNNNKLFNIGLKITLTPIILIATIIGYGFIREVFTSKPDKKDLVGKYVMSDASFISNEKEKYTLQFFNSGKYKITETPNIDLCENGEYDVDYQFDGNELSFKCDGGYRIASIDRGFGGYRIQFVIGDPDSGESIYFEKVKND